MMVRLGIAITAILLLLVLSLSALVGHHKAVPVNGQMPTVRQNSQMIKNGQMLAESQTGPGLLRVRWARGSVRCWPQPGPASPGLGWQRRTGGGGGIIGDIDAIVGQQ
jgi:hypothetical protein